MADTVPTNVACAVCGGTDWRKRFTKQGYDFVACQACGLMRLEPLPTPEQLDRHYATRATAGNYEPVKSEERRSTADYLFDKARGYADPASRRILDIGCFDGHLLDAAKEAGWETWGLELQEDAVARARINHGDRILVGTVEKYVVPHRNYFDLVTATGLIEHLIEPDKLFAIATEALKPGGVILIQTPNNGSVPARLMGRYWPPIAAPEHVYYFSHRNLRRLAARSGFETLSWWPHWKTLRLGYVIEQFQFFGEEIGRVLNRVLPYIPRPLLKLRLPLYGGEMVFVARKKA